MRIVSSRPGDLVFPMREGPLVLRQGETTITASKWDELRAEHGQPLDALKAEGWLQWDEPPAVTVPVLPEPVRVAYETEPEPVRIEAGAGVMMRTHLEPSTQRLALFGPAPAPQPPEAPRRRSRAKRG